ncbi:MAG: hypothetical protein [Namikivirus ikeda]|uniref:Uncharacterized protein n=1 Tax=Bacteriophage sp. TaxID=38018 RepID=A0ABY5TS56_9VIRU|nr:MAG: hypothetical protein [Bacteriophage sp.]
MVRYERKPIMNVYESVSKSITERYGVRFREETKEKACKFFAGLCMKFGEDEVLEAWDIACAKYDNPVTALSKLGGILYNRSLFSSFIEEA